MIHIVVADRSEALRLGVRAVFERQELPYAVHEAADRGELLSVLESRRCDLVLLEPMLCGGTGENLIRQLRALAPNAHVLVYTDMDELSFGVRALRSGAKGYLMKKCTSSELVTAASRVSRGRIHMSERLAEEFAISIWEGNVELPHAGLSEREQQVFAMIVCGRSVTEIGRLLNLSVKTISTHKTRAMRKLRCRNLSELIQYAVAHELTAECETLCAGF